MKKSVLLILFLLALFAIGGCRELKDVQVTDVEGFDMKKLNTEGIEAEVRLKIKNPNATGFSIYPSEFDVVYSGIHLGKAKLHKRVHIGRNSEKVYTFLLKSKFGEINIMDAAKLLNMGNHGNVELNGDLKAGKFYLKKRYPVNFKKTINMFK